MVYCTVLYVEYTKRTVWIARERTNSQYDILASLLLGSRLQYLDCFASIAISALSPRPMSDSTLLYEVVVRLFLPSALASSYPTCR